MKFNSLILLAIFSFFLFSCDSGLKFDNPLENNPDANNQGNSDAEMQDEDSNEQTDTEPTDSEPTDTEPDNPDSTPEQSDNGDSEPDDTDTDDSGDSQTDNDADTADSIDDSGDSQPDDSDTTDDADTYAPDEDADEPDEEPTTRTATCSGLPANASWHNSSSITQTFDGNDWYPQTTGFYSETAVANECGFKCNQGYEWNGNQCVKPSTPCNPNPCTSISNSTGNCTVNGTGYICGCQSGYEWSVNLCIMTAEEECSEAGGTWDSDECTKTADCPSKPANTVWNDNGANGTYTQTWSSSNGWTPASQTSSYSTTAGVCQYKCASGFNWTNGSCTSGGSSTLPECSKNSKTPCNDSASGLTWSAKASNAMNWRDAKTHCTGLNSSNYGGFNSGWHLPTISELRTLIQNCEGTKFPGGTCGIRDDDSITCLSTQCETDVCGGCSSDSTGGHSKFGETDQFWSSSTQAPTNSIDTTVKAWHVDFETGKIDTDYKALRSLSVRCVRNAE